MVLPRGGKGAGWQPLTYAANWSDFGAGVPTAGYMKDATGRVWLKGGAKKAVALVANDVICTLPAAGGYRPATSHDFSVASVAPDNYTRVRVDTAGNVFIGAGGSQTLTWLDGISFDPLT